MVDWVDNESASNYRVFTANDNSLNITLKNLLLNGGHTDNGGTIYFKASSVTLDHVTVSGSRADESGGGIYIRAKGANILYSSICGNKSGESGSGLSLGIEGVEGIYGYSIIESTIAKNQCIIPSNVKGGGGALHILASPIEKANYSIINSTIVSNTTNKGCAGIRAAGIIQDMMQFSLVNSIVLGNYTGSNQYNMEVLEQVSAHYTNSLYADDVNLSTVFKDAVPSLAGDLKSVTLATNGPAILGGTLAGMIGTECYYKSGSQWVGTVSGTKYTYDSSASDYGLTGGTVYTTALNGVSRVASDEIFTMGSTAYKMETGGLEVNTRDGALNFFDGWISLADAIYYAQHGLTDANGNYNITFSDGMFRQGDIITNFSVTIDADSFSASKPLTIDGRNAVILNGENTRQLFNIAAGNSVVLFNMTVQNSKGSAITNAGTLTIANLIFSGNEISTTGGNGGAISNSGNLDISNSTFQNNIASMNGGAIYNTGTLTSNNSTFLGNIARDGNGGAIYNAAETATLTLVNSTVTGNTGVRFGTGINNNTGTLFLLNSIVAGNIGTSSNTVYDIYAASGQNISAYYSTLGTIRKNLAEGASALKVSIGTTINKTALDVFGTTSPALDSKNTVPLSSGGTATLSGTLVGKIGNDFYYKDGNTWKSFTNETTYKFSSTGTNYGLTGGTVYTAGRNGVSRVATLAAFNAGAYALAAERVSTVVTTISDITNPFDNQITLREAISYAAANSTITFDTTVFGTTKTITVTSTLTIDKNLTINGAGKVILDGGHTDTTDGFQIMYISSGKTVVLSDLTFQNGYSEDVGGAIYNLGTLTVNNSTFSGNSAKNIGGAIWNSSGTLTVNNSTFSGNSVSTYGGAIHNSSGTLTVNNSTFSGNSVTDDGGGAICNSSGTLTVNNSTFSGNSAKNIGGAIYNNDGSLTLINSTFSGNTATNGAAIYSDGTGTVYLVNSVFVGNGTEDIKNSSGSMNAYYCVYGTLSGTLKNNVGNTTGATVSNVFGTNTFDGKTIAISAAGAAAKSGTLTAVKDGVYYFKDGANGWKKLSDASDASDMSDYAITTDQLNNSRLGDAANYGMYSAGAVFVNAATETKSLVVNTTDGKLNPYDGLISIHDAIAYAGTDSLGSNITFDSNVFATAQTITLTSTLTINKDLTIDGAGKVILDGGHTATTDGVLIMSIDGEYIVTLSNLTLQNGYKAFAIGLINASGAISNNGGTLTLNNSTFSGNTSEMNSGAIYNSASGTLTVINSTFSGNSATFSGGAISNKGMLTVNNSTFSGNSASSSGAIYNFNGTLTVNNSVFSNNTAKTDGGAIINKGMLTVNNSTFSGNSASRSGGAIYSASILPLANSIMNSTFTGNSAKTGGAIDCVSIENNVYLYLLNSIFVGNTATQVGADINTTISNAYYCVYGSATGTIGGANNVSGATVADVFGSNTFNGKTIAISASGPAANSGTLTAVKDGVYYFKDGANGWKKLSDGSTTTEDLSSNTINTDQLGNSRTTGDAAGYGVYSAGAVFVDAAKEAKSLVVNLTTDTVNPYDGKYSLREAISYAGLDSLGYNITFADSIFTDGKAIITLASDIVFANTLSGKAVTINGGDGRVVTVKAQVTYAESVANNTPASNYRVFTIGTDSDRTHIWNLSLKNMTLQGGAVDGDGGAIYMYGADSYLTLDNVTISDSKAGNDGGGIALYAKRNSGTATLLLNMVNSTVTGNTAGASGGGIATITHGDNSSPSSLTINLVNSTVSNNCFGNFGSFGGGIYAWANSGNKAATLMVNLVDSSIVGNYSPKYSQYAGLYINNAAYTSNDSVTTVNLLNSVVFGNTAKGAELYIQKFRGSLAFNTTYSVYGTCTTTPNSSVGCPDMTGKTIADVFALEDGNIKYENGIPVISGSGLAAYSGTLTGKVGSDYYYKDGNAWKSFTKETTYSFDSTGTNYGLGDGATVYTTGQNGISRVATLAAFNAGAYALALETASTVVTTNSDNTNPFDNQITIRRRFAPTMN